MRRCIEKPFKSEPIILFEKGLNNCANYRIPSMITTKKGTVIATIDARVDEPGDNPNNIDKVIRCSKDNGLTWSEPKLLVDYPGHGAKEGSAAIDPAVLEDRETDTIWMIFSHTPGGVGLWNSKVGTGFNKDGYRLLYDKDDNEYVLKTNGEVFDKDNKKTNINVYKTGDVYKENIKLGNIYLNEGVLLEERTSFLQIIYSKDDGESWSEPIDLNTQVKEEWMRFVGAGPGIGIQLTKPKYKGRIIFPIYFSNSNAKLSCCVMYSDDHGQTWKRGKSPNDGRKFNGEVLQAETMNYNEAQLTEAQVIELENGDLKIFMRNHDPKRRTAFAISKDGGETWGEINFIEELLDPICQSTVIKYSNLELGENVVIFANPASESSRINGTVRLSEDEGHTWKYSKLLKEGSYLYSCLTVLPNNNIGLLYEAEDNEDMKVYFTSFNLEWIKAH